MAAWVSYTEDCCTMDTPPLQVGFGGALVPHRHPDRWLRAAQRHLQTDDGPAGAVLRKGGLSHDLRILSHRTSAAMPSVTGFCAISSLTASAATSHARGSVMNGSEYSLEHILPPWPSQYGFCKSREQSWPIHSCMSNSPRPI
jgi:hypothetical protein